MLGSTICVCANNTIKCVVMAVITMSGTSGKSRVTV